MPNVLAGLERRRLTAAFLCAVLGSAGCAGRPAAPEPARAPAAAPSPAADYRSIGPANAPVLMIEFSDLQCPYCARFAIDTFPELRRRYVDTGKLRFESHDLPLPFHPYALPAAIAARCAGEQGRFWEYRDALFHSQTQLPGAPYDALAARLGLDSARFNACRNEPRIAEEVRADAALAAAKGVSSTPTLVVGRVVNGQMAGEAIVGAQPLDVFAQKIDELLKQ